MKNTWSCFYSHMYLITKRITTFVTHLIYQNNIIAKYKNYKLQNN